MTSKIITISGKGVDIVERLRDGIESSELIDLFGLKFVGVRLETGVHAGEPFAGMIARQVAVVQPAPWSVDGLPPVGTECEVLNNDLSNAAWEKCTILFAGKHRIVYDSESCHERVGYRDCLQFRPIKTPAQVSAELADQEVKKIAAIICRDGAFDIDDPEVSESAVALYDAGLRFPKGGDQ